MHIYYSLNGSALAHKWAMYVVLLCYTHSYTAKFLARSAWTQIITDRHISPKHEHYWARWKWGAVVRSCEQQPCCCKLTALQIGWLSKSLPTTSSSYTSHRVACFCLNPSHMPCKIHSFVLTFLRLGDLRSSFRGLPKCSLQLSAVMFKWSAVFGQTAHNC